MTVYNELRQAEVRQKLKIFLCFVFTKASKSTQLRIEWIFNSKADNKSYMDYFDGFHLIYQQEFTQTNMNQIQSQHDNDS